MTENDKAGVCGGLQDKADTPRPAWSETATLITVQEARELAAKHGQEGMVILAFSKALGVNVVTVGKNDFDSNYAAALAQYVLEAMGVKIPGQDKAEESVSPASPASPASLPGA